MNREDKEILTKATKILCRFFEPGNAKIERMRKQQNKWILSDELDKLGEIIEFIEKIRDNKIKELYALDKNNGVKNGS